MYRRREHVINLFTWPVQPETGGHEATMTRQGYLEFQRTMSRREVYEGDR